MITRNHVGVLHQVTPQCGTWPRHSQNKGSHNSLHLKQMLISKSTHLPRHYLTLLLLLLQPYPILPPSLPIFTYPPHNTSCHLEEIDGYPEWWAVMSVRDRTTLLKPSRLGSIAIDIQKVPAMKQNLWREKQKMLNGSHFMIIQV